MQNQPWPWLLWLWGHMGSHGIYSQSRLTIATDTVAFTTKNFPFASKIYLSVAILRLFFCLAKWNNKIEQSCVLCLTSSCQGVMKVYCYYFQVWTKYTWATCMLKLPSVAQQNFHSLIRCMKKLLSSDWLR